MKSNPKAKITDEHREESRLLKEIWDSSGHGKLTQAEFGHQYGIGTQAAVGFFLNGKSAISMKAAKGFARGLGCPISAFSKRLATEADEAISMSGGSAPPKGDAPWPFLTVSPSQYFEVLTQNQRNILEATANSFVNARESPEKHLVPANNKKHANAA